MRISSGRKAWGVMSAVFVEALKPGAPRREPKLLLVLRPLGLLHCGTAGVAVEMPAGRRRHRRPRTPP